MFFVCFNITSGQSPHLLILRMALSLTGVIRLQIIFIIDLTT